MKVYTAPETNNKRTVVFGAIVVVVLALTVVGFSRSRKVEQPERQPVTIAPPITREFTPAAKAEISKEPERGSVAKAAETEPEKVAKLEPPKRTSIETEKYKIELKNVSCRIADNVVGKVNTEFICRFHDLAKGSDFAAVISEGRAWKVESTAGEVFEPGGNFGVPDPFWDLNPPRPPYADFRVRFTLPDRVNTLRSVQSSVSLVRKGKTETLVWDDLSKIKGVTKTYGEFQFTIADYDADADSVRTEFIYQFPRGKPPQEPDLWAPMFIKPALRLENGDRVYSSGGGGGGMPDRRFRMNNTFKLAGRKAAAFEISFVSSIMMEDIPFTFESIPLSVPKVAAPVAEGPRGDKKVQSDGFTFNLQTIERANEQTPTIQLKMFVAHPKDRTIVAVAGNARGAVATDDLGKEFRETTSFPSFYPPGPGGMQYTAIFPASEADRYTSFKGKYEVFIADENPSVEIEIPSDLSKFEPIERAPVKLTKLSATGDVLAVHFDLATSALADQKQIVNWCYKYELRDAANLPMTFMGSGGEYSPDRSIARIRANYSLAGKTPARLVVRYVSKGHLQEIPFEFFNVGLPRVGVKPDSEKSKF